MIALLLERLNSLNPMSEELTEKIISVTKTIDYPAGTYILKEGQTCTRACMIGKGLARSYYINDGKEITSRFMDEGFIITSWISYYIQKADNLSKGDKAGLIDFSVIVALGLVLLVGALACELSCSEYEGAALLVGIGGTALIIFLLLITIRAIKKSKKEPKEEPVNTN